MSNRCRVMAVLGTRPEAIKLALVIQELRQHSEEFETAVVHTGQHRSMLDDFLKLFQIKPDFELDVMRQNQTLSLLTGRIVLLLPARFIGAVEPPVARGELELGAMELALP